MKNLTLNFLLSSIAFLIIHTTHAQDALKEGNRILGGGLSFSMSESQVDNQYWNFDDYHIDDDEVTSTSFGISPYYGRFFKDYMMIGIRMNAYTQSREADYATNDYSFDETTSKTINFGVGTFIRSYFPITEKVGAFFEPGLAFDRTIYSQTSTSYDSGYQQSYVYQYEYDQRLNTLSIDMRLGIYLFLLDQLSLETNLASMVASFGFGTRETHNLLSDKVEEFDESNSRINFNFVNSFTMDRLFTINYYF